MTEVETLGDHRLRLRFEAGAQGELDFSNRVWRGVFEPLANPAFFDRVRVDPKLGTIMWPNGADIAPETLHGWVTGSSNGTPRSRRLLCSYIRRT